MLENKWDNIAPEVPQDFHNKFEDTLKQIDMTDEAEILQRLRNREKNSIDEAIRIYTPYLSTVLYHMAGNSLPKEDIEEIVADVFVVLWKNSGRIDSVRFTIFL